MSGLHVPQELIRAHGFEPVALLPKVSGQRPPTAGRCAAAQGWADALLSAERRFAAAVLTTRCDQLRRTAEALRAQTGLPLFLLNVPVTHGTAAARRLHEDELTRLDCFLSRVGEGLRGVPACGRGGTVEADADACGEASLPDDAAAAAGSGRCGGFRVGLLACGLTDADLVVIHLLRQTGLRIAVNATESPLEAAGECLTSSLQTSEPQPSVAQRPNAPFFAWLREAGRAAGLEGWVLVRQPWCDLYHAEVPRLRAETALPWLDLETGACPALAALRTRAEAFAEMLRAGRDGTPFHEEGARA